MISTLTSSVVNVDDVEESILYDLEMSLMKCYLTKMAKSPRSRIFEWHPASRRGDPEAGCRQSLDAQSWRGKPTVCSCSRVPFKFLTIRRCSRNFGRCLRAFRGNHTMRLMGYGRPDQGVLRLKCGIMFQPASLLLSVPRSKHLSQYLIPSCLDYIY